MAGQEPTFSASSYLVIVPVTVTQQDGTPADGLEASDFALLDNGHPVRFDADGYVPPISLVIAVQTGNLAAASLTRLRDLGPLIEPLLIGQRGKAAVIAYDHQVRLIQSPTNDAGALKSAFAGLKPRGGNTGRMLDGIEAALGVLREAPADSRRVLLVIGESKDRKSEAKLAATLTDVQRENVLVYALTYSPFLSPWTVKNDDLPKTPCCNLIESLAELGRLGKEKTAEVLTRETGGRLLGFLTRDAMEQAVTHIGEELHSQYLLSFNAAAAGESAGGAYHLLEVRMPRHPELKVRTRPGYWLAP
jgi:VWFA-related protein